MDYFDLISNAIDYIEDNIQEPLSLEQISRRYFLSRFHFTRIFHAVTQQPYKTYVDERRLNLAAVALRSSQRKIIDISLDAGFQSHTAFTRRFRQLFGLSPSAYRKSTEPPVLRPKARIARRKFKQIGSSIAPSFTLINLPAIRLLGTSWQFIPESPVELETLNHNFMRFLNETVLPLNISTMYNLTSSVTIPGDTLNYFSGFVASGLSIPQNLIAHQIPAGTYAVFRYCGNMKDIFETIFNDICFALITSGLQFHKTELDFFEWYEENYFQDRWFKICVPVLSD
jgi:AraC family transcriptional regulator